MAAADTSEGAPPAAPPNPYDRATAEGVTDFLSLADHHPDSVIRYDAQGRITFLNRKLQGYLGVTDAADVLGKRPREVWPDGRFDRIEAAVYEAVTQGSSSVIEYTEPTANGDEIHHSVRVVAETDAQGRPVGAWGFGGRVTELRRAEKAAHKSAAMFRSLAKNSPDIIIRYGVDGHALYFNPTLPRVVRGWRALIDGSFVTADAGGDGPATLAAALRRVLTTGQRETVEILLPTPRDAPARHEIILVPEKAADGAVTGALCLGRDVTLRKRLERELGDVLRCAHAFVAHAEVTAGPAWDPRDPEGSAEGLDWRITYDDVEVARALFPLATPPGREYAEAWASAAHPDDQHAERRAAARALAAGAPSFRVQFRATDRDGAEHWFEQVGSVEPVEPGRWRITTINTDITQPRALQAHLRQTQKLEALGLLAGGVAHDFNNIIAAILLQAEILGQEELTRDGRDVLVELRDTADRAAQLVRQLLAFSRKQVMQAEVQDLNAIIRNFSKMLRRFVREDVALDLTLSPEATEVRCDTGMMEQVMMNLASNACDAMPRGGQLSVTTSVEAVAEGGESAHPRRLGGGEYVCLKVSDSGSGIAADVLPQIFDPFFTTKEHGKGTGLGLATVFGIVQQHGGSVHVDSCVGAGTTFEVYLPRARAPTRPVDAAPERRLARGAGRILLVEDNSAVRNATRMVLERSGYRVLEATDGVSALATWETHGGAVDLVLTDMIMPGGLSGRELAARLRSQSAQLTVIFTSGYNEETADLEGELFLAKPCPPHVLLEAVSRALARA